MEEPEIKKMSAKEFRELGYLQEVNRVFLHPIGLALETVKHNDDSETFGEVWDYRDDPEGMLFGEGMIDREKMERINHERAAKAKARVDIQGSIVQVR